MSRNEGKRYFSNNKSGDWTCKCGELNFSSRKNCRKCGFETNHAPITSGRSGDWMCCGELNFASRNNCRKCGGENKNKTVAKGRPGDWNCVCGELNFSSRHNCRKCGIENNNGTVTQPKFEEGDWICTNDECKEHNFKTRHICRKCLNPKPKDETNDVENMCAVCMTDPRTHAIMKCGHLLYCGVCGFAITKCPVCRVEYDPGTDLKRIYNI